MKVRGWTLTTSWPVVTLWILVTLCVATSSLVALFMPTWYVRDTIGNIHDDRSKNGILTASFGVWSWCMGWDNPECTSLGQSIGFVRSLEPSNVWAMVGSIYGGGAFLLTATGLATFLTPLFRSTHIRSSFAHIASNLQAAAVSLQALGLILYPLGLGSPFCRDICGPESTVYYAGECHLGYAYMLALVSTSLAAYCPILARLITYKDYSDYFSNMNYL